MYGVMKEVKGRVREQWAGRVCSSEERGESAVV